MALLLTVEALRVSVPDEFAHACGKRVLCVDGCHLQQPPLNPAAMSSLPSRSGEDLLYIFYTSGTTGRPKGVMVAHEALCHRVGWLQTTFQLAVSESVIQKAAYGFGVSEWEVFWPLLVGGTLVMAKPGGHKDPLYLLELSRTYHVAVLFFVPSLLAVFVETLELEGAP